VLAAGSHERPLVFGGNDRPGVMTASAVRTYINRYGVSPGRSGVVFTNNNSGYRTARDLVAAGIEVRAVVDSRDRRQALDCGGVAVLKGAVVTDVKGGKQVAGARDRPRGRRSRAAGLRLSWPCRAAGTRRCILPATKAQSPCGTTSSPASCRPRPARPCAPPARRPGVSA
jgi:NADPH-dependent 2,4-dienoyl-CoA reductase/sulfur reductase-like enzyme